MEKYLSTNCSVWILIKVFTIVDFVKYNSTRAWISSWRWEHLMGTSPRGLVPLNLVSGQSTDCGKCHADQRGISPSIRSFGCPDHACSPPISLFADGEPLVRRELASGEVLFLLPFPPGSGEVPRCEVVQARSGEVLLLVPGSTSLRWLLRRSVYNATPLSRSSPTSAVSSVTLT